MASEEKKKPSVVVQICNALLVGVITFLAIQVWHHYQPQQSEEPVPEVVSLLSFSAPGSIGLSLGEMKPYDFKIPFKEGSLLSTEGEGEFVLLMNNGLQLSLSGTATVQVFENSLQLHEGACRLNRVGKKYPEGFTLKIKTISAELKTMPAMYSVE